MKKVSKYGIQTCKICKEKKPLSAFYGKNRKCKLCYSQQYFDDKTGAFRKILKNGGNCNGVDNHVLVETTPNIDNEWITAVSIYGDEWFTTKKTMDKKTAYRNHISTIEEIRADRDYYKTFPVIHTPLPNHSATHREVV